ncbi:MAG: hypothetical protein HY926_11375 [Elusimicrobia bacterium]|nr:hypothetical protein [Elusimicrobiota bacterium]
MNEALSRLRPGRPGLQDAVALAAVLALALIGYGFLLAPGCAPYSPFSDFLAGSMPRAAILYESLHSGHGLPFWRGDELSGFAAFTSPLSAYTCPLSILFWLLPPLEAYGPTLWLVFLAAGVIAYFCGRALGVGTWPALFLAAAQMFNFKLIIAAGVGWLPVFSNALVLPLLFIAVARALERPGAASALGVALAGALALHSGHPQLLYYSVLFLAAFAALRASPRGLAALAVGGVLAAGLAGFLLVPLALESGLLSRGRASYEFFLSGHGLTWRHLLTFLHPEALGSPLSGSYPGVELWEDVAYIGLAPLALAAAGLALTWRQARTRLLAAALLASLALALRSPLQRLLFDAVPGFHLFRLPGRALFLTGWFALALAGLGLEEVLRRLRRRLPSPWPAAAAALLIAATAWDGARYARRYIAMLPRQQLLPDADFRRFFAGRDRPYRIAPLERHLIHYGWAAPMGLELAAGFSSYNYSHYQGYCDVLRWGRPRDEGARVWTDIPAVSRPDLLDALNVRFLVSSRELRLPPGRFALAARLKDQPVFAYYRGLTRSDMCIYENRLARPRAFFADRAVLAGSAREALDRIRHSDLRRAAVVEADRAEAAAPPGPGDRLEVVESRAGRLVLRARAAGPRFLVASEVWHPGWRATIDSRPLVLRKTDFALLGAWLPPGDHRLELDFRPPGWGLGWALAALSAVLCAALGFRAVSRRR